MVYYTVVLWRRSDLTHDEFRRIWLGEHLPMAQQLPGLIEAKFLPRANEDDTAPDGLGLLTFASHDELVSALASPQSRALRAHTATFADSEAAVRLIAEDPAL
jgi:uncharacterized protein (TIGR02118 family)